MKPKHLSPFSRYFVASIWMYHTLLLIWFLAFSLTGDRFPWIALLNNMAVYLFLPLPITIAAAIYYRRRDLWLCLATGILFFILLWGKLFLPNFSQKTPASETLSVMTFNAYGFRESADEAISLILASDADVVCLQEVNHLLAKALEEKLSGTYPYQVLDPYNDPRGMGTISKFPLVLTGDTLPLNWVGVPQIMQLDWVGEPVTIINFHMWAITLGNSDYLDVSYRTREAQALFLTNFARRESFQRPVLLMGDSNTTAQSDVHRRLSTFFVDSWLAAGWGFGHTFPGQSNAEPLVTFLGMRVPQWILRLDYIFHSDQFQTYEAWLAPYDGHSDHRAVLARLSLH
jgi:vancomycin resistance protein VanJ